MSGRPAGLKPRIGLDFRIRGPATGLGNLLAHLIVHVTVFLYSVNCFIVILRPRSGQAPRRARTLRLGRVPRP